VYFQAKAPRAPRGVSQAKRPLQLLAPSVFPKQPLKPHSGCVSGGLRPPPRCVWRKPSKVGRQPKAGKKAKAGSSKWRWGGVYTFLESSMAIIRQLVYCSPRLSGWKPWTLNIVTDEFLKDLLFFTLELNLAMRAAVVSVCTSPLVAGRL
jgi:hypothetical protein